jgi:hypothetical protein
MCTSEKTCVLQKKTCVLQKKTCVLQEKTCVLQKKHVYFRKKHVYFRKKTCLIQKKTCVIQKKTRVLQKKKKHWTSEKNMCTSEKRDAKAFQLSPVAVQQCRKVLPTADIMTTSIRTVGLRPTHVALEGKCKGITQIAMGTGRETHKKKPVAIFR